MWEPGLEPGTLDYEPRKLPAYYIPPHKKFYQAILYEPYAFLIIF